MRIDPSGLTGKEIYQLMSGAIVPRPIAWVSTVGANGVHNLAPFSYFSGICSRPPTICLSIARRNGDKKDTVLNIEWAGDFVINVVDETLVEKMNQTSADYPPEVSEFDVVGLTPIRGDRVKSPRVGEAPISMECRLVQMLEFGDPPDRTSLIIGEIVQMHIVDRVLRDGKIDFAQLRAVGRLAGDLYCRTGDLLSLKRPRLPSR